MYRAWKNCIRHFRWPLFGEGATTETESIRKGNIKVDLGEMT